MRRNPELLILAGLLIAAIAAVLWYVADRRAKLRATPSTALVQSSRPEPMPGPATSSLPSSAAPKSTEPASPVRRDQPLSDLPSSQPVAKNSAEDKATPVGATASSQSAEPVDLTKHDQQTIDFSGGKPVVKNSAEDKAAIDAAMKDIQSAEKEVTFEAPKKDASPPK